MTFYFLITVLAVMPNNYFKITNKEFFDRFDQIFYQRWNFFAPPPKTNFRLYFEYKNADSKIIYRKLEVMKKLLKDKREKAPFNGYEEMMDYQLYGCVNIITTLLSDLTKQSQFISPDSTGTYHALYAIKKYNTEYSKGPELLSLKRYAKLCAENMSFYHKMTNPELRIIICVQDLPSFSSQFNFVKDDKNASHETLVFKSDFISLK